MSEQLKPLAWYSPTAKAARAFRGGTYTVPLFADARADLARKVLTEVEDWRHAPAASNIHKRLCDLFTREQIDLGETT